MTPTVTPQSKLLLDSIHTVQTYLSALESGTHHNNNNNNNNNTHNNLPEAHPDNPEICPLQKPVIGAGQPILACDAAEHGYEDCYYEPMTCPQGYDDAPMNVVGYKALCTCDRDTDTYICASVQIQCPNQEEEGEGTKSETAIIVPQSVWDAIQQMEEVQGRLEQAEQQEATSPSRAYDVDVQSEESMTFEQVMQQPQNRNDQDESTSMAEPDRLAMIAQEDEAILAAYDSASATNQAIDIDGTINMEDGIDIDIEGSLNMEDSVAEDIQGAINMEEGIAEDIQGAELMNEKIAEAVQGALFLERNEVDEALADALDWDEKNTMMEALQTGHNTITESVVIAHGQP